MSYQGGNASYRGQKSILPCYNSKHLVKMLSHFWQINAKNILPIFVTKGPNEDDTNSKKAWISVFSDKFSVWCTIQKLLTINPYVIYIWTTKPICCEVTLHQQGLAEESLSAMTSSWNVIGWQNRNPFSSHMTTCWVYKTFDFPYHYQVH